MPIWFLLTIGGVFFVSFAEIAQEKIVANNIEIKDNMGLLNLLKS